MPRPVGLFGHSQGGWVVVEAAARRPEIAYVVANSGPGFAPIEQERYSNRTYLAAARVADREFAEAVALFDELERALRRGATYAEVRSRFEARLPAAYAERPLVLFPEDEAFWGFLLRVFDYDPRPALERIGVPVLALFGADDALVPVDASVAVYREAVQPELLTVAVFAGADHRLQVGDPARLADGYLERLATFALASASSARVAGASATAGAGRR